MSCEIFPPAMPDIRNGCVYTLGIGDTFSKPYLLFNYKNPRKALSKMNDTMLCYIKMIIWYDTVDIRESEDSEIVMFQETWV